jgi:hypothetical protein
MNSNPLTTSFIVPTSSLCFPATLAQLVEQRFCKPQVVSSSLTGGFHRLHWINSNFAASGCISKISL